MPEKWVRNGNYTYLGKWMRSAIVEVKEGRFTFMVQKVPTILVVDHDEHTLEMIELLLVREGYRVATASTGQSALAIINSELIDLIILDPAMPGYSGLEALITVRTSKNRSKKNIPVIIISERSAVEDIDAAIAAEATSYLVKPFRPEALIVRIAQILNPLTK